MHLSSSNKDSSSSTPPHSGEKVGETAGDALSGLDIYLLNAFRFGLSGSAKGRDREGTHIEGHLPIAVTSGRGQVLMPSVPVVTDQLELQETGT